MIKKILPALVLTVISLALIFAVFRQGFYTSHDGIFHIYRIEEAWSMLKLGEFPLRWAGNFDQGFGIPLFTFVYPLPYYLGGILSHVMGSIWALKTVIVFSYVLGGLGAYIYFKKLGEIRAVTLSLIYLMTPYLFVNIFVRGALGEIMALGLIPWVLVSYDNLEKEKKGVRWYHPLPLAFLLIAHNFLGVLFTVFLIGKIIFSGDKKIPELVSLIASLGLSAFFLVPMVGEKNLLYSFDHNFLTFRYDQHFVYWRQFLYGKWDYWYSVEGPNDGMSFQLGFAPMVLTVLGAGAILLKKQRKWADLYLLVAYAGSLFLMTGRSDFIWKHISILQTVQFPWRLLFMPAILSPIIGSYFLIKVKNQKVLVGICTSILLLGFWNVRNYRRPMKYLDLTEFTDLYRLYYNKTSTTFRTEILPKWSGENERYKNDEMLVNSGNMIIDSLASGPLSLIAQINDKPDSSEARVTILRNYYPGWKIVVDGKKSIELSPDKEGMIIFHPELGVHTYRLHMQETPLELFADCVSLISLIGIGYLGVKERWIKKKSKSN